MKSFLAVVLVTQLIVAIFVVGAVVGYTIASYLDFINPEIGAIFGTLFGGSIVLGLASAVTSY